MDSADASTRSEQERTTNLAAFISWLEYNHDSNVRNGAICATVVFTGTILLWASFDPYSYPWFAPITTFAILLLALVHIFGNVEYNKPKKALYTHWCVSVWLAVVVTPFSMGRNIYCDSYGCYDPQGFPWHVIVFFVLSGNLAIHTTALFRPEWLTPLKIHLFVAYMVNMMMYVSWAMAQRSRYVFPYFFIFILMSITTLTIHILTELRRDGRLASIKAWLRRTFTAEGLSEAVHYRTVNSNTSQDAQQQQQAPSGPLFCYTIDPETGMGMFVPFVTGTDSSALRPIPAQPQSSSLLQPVQFFSPNHHQQQQQHEQEQEHVQEQEQQQQQQQHDHTVHNSAPEAMESV